MILTPNADQIRPNSRKIVEVRCDECLATFTRVFRVLVRNQLKIHRCVSCNRRDIFERSCRGKAYGKLHGSSNPMWKSYTPAFRRYRTTVSRLTRKTYAKYRDIINPDNLPRTRSGCEGGYQLDHIITVLKGFQMGINPLWIADLSNLRMLSWEENIGREQQRLREQMNSINKQKQRAK